MSLPLNQVIIGDSGEVMAEWPGNSVDCIVTDPPYRIGFMGSSWDRALPPRRVFRQIFRVLKPGALAFIMSSPRQDVLWRMLSMLEGIGFEMRQSFISWIYKTGFPKAYDVSKGIDRKLGLERKIVGKDQYANRGAGIHGSTFKYDKSDAEKRGDINEPASDLAKQWEGWKSQTGLKPALECILMVNKPLSESTIVDNVLKWGTGAINVDACRIPYRIDENPTVGGRHKIEGSRLKFGGEAVGTIYSQEDAEIDMRGRFPANLLISDGALDTGETTKSGSYRGPKQRPREAFFKERVGQLSGSSLAPDSYGDEGSPFRFFDLDAWAEHHGFIDVAKPSKAERDMGLWRFQDNYDSRIGDGIGGAPSLGGSRQNSQRNLHPTVKPIKLMAYLIELGCPPSGIVVDPFLGSGTTCIIAKRLRRKWIGIEINPEYAEIAEARINIRGPLDQFIDEK